MATIVDVAKRADVSTATVSRVISGNTDLVAPKTHQRVLRAIESLGYTPNSAAQTLRILRSRKILVTVPDIANPAFAPVVQGVEAAARREGYTVLLGDTHRTKEEEPYSLILRRKEADGLIFVSHRLPRETASLVRAVAKGRAPLVNVLEFTPRLGVPFVHINNADAASDAMNHLYRLGHRRVGIVTGPTISPASRDRLRGAIRSARRAGAFGDLTVAHGDWGVQSGSDAAGTLLSRASAPTAVLCFNDEMAIGVMEVARQRGIQIPADLSVVGFDDIRLAQYFNPPLTTIATPLRELGEQAVRVLVDILRGNTVTQLSVTLPHELRVRSTTAPPRPRTHPRRRV